MPLKIFGDDRSVDALFTANAVGFQRGRAKRFVSKILSPGAYIDNRKLPSHPAAWEIVLKAMIQQAFELRKNYDVIASVATGGIIHGGAIARELRIPHVIVKKQEKDHGLGGLIDGDAGLLPQAKVLLFEDLASTFQSSQRAIGTLNFAGAWVTEILLIDAWDFPELHQNVVGQSVHTLTTGSRILKRAIDRNAIDKEHAALVSLWLQNPRDESWAQDGTWELPQGEK